MNDDNALSFNMVWLNSLSMPPIARAYVERGEGRCSKRKSIQQNFFYKRLMKHKSIDYSAISKERSNIAESARKMAENRRKRSPYSAEKQGSLIQKLSDYVESQKAEGKPLTIAGFMLASGIPKKTWYEMRDGRYDASIEEYKMLKGIPEDAENYVTEDGEVLPLVLWSDVIERCYLLAQQEREEACVAGKAGNVIGNIFLLKAHHGLNDQPDHIQHQQNIQIVANSEMALKALEMCKK